MGSTALISALRSDLSSFKKICRQIAFPIKFLKKNCPPYSESRSITSTFPWICCSLACAVCPWKGPPNMGAVTIVALTAPPADPLSPLQWSKPFSSYNGTSRWFWLIPMLFTSVIIPFIPTEFPWEFRTLTASTGWLCAGAGCVTTALGPPTCTDFHGIFIPRAPLSWGTPMKCGCGCNCEDDIVGSETSPGYLEAGKVVKIPCCSRCWTFATLMGKLCWGTSFRS